MAKQPDRTRNLPAPSWRAATILLAGLGSGLLTGWIEVVVHTIRQHLLHRTLMMGREFVWQLPLADALIFSVAAGLLLVIARLAPRLRAPKVVTGYFAWLGVFALLLLSERIHPAAEAVLGVGLGVAIARVLAPRAAGLQRVLRVGVPAVLALVLVTAVGQRVVRATAERRGLARLPVAEPGRPNVLLLVLDTVRAWSLGLYGYARPTTPRLQEWTARGALFERVLTAAPWTTPSHAVMFTGRHPSELSVSWDRPLDASFPTLAEVLQRAGYATAGFVGNFTQAGSPTGLDRGFLRYEDYPATLLSMLRRTALLRRLFALDRVGRLVGRRRMLEATPAERLNQDFLRWVSERSGRPWFAFLNYNEAHGPYLPPAPYDTMYFSGPAPAVDRYWDNLVRAYGPPPVPIEDLAISVDAYDGAITYLDREIDALLRELEGRGLLANTVVVVTSDHGELFGEHGVIAHGNSLFLPVLRVPLLIVAPGRVPVGIKIGSLASLRDLPATLLELAGIPNPGLPGYSLTALWGPAGPASVTDTLFSFVEYNRRLPKWPPSPVLKGSLQSIVLDSLQYIRNGDGTEELYHLGHDPWEVNNLVSDSIFHSDLARYRAALRSIPHR